MLESLSSSYPARALATQNFHSSFFNLRSFSFKEFHLNYGGIPLIKEEFP